MIHLFTFWTFLLSPVFAQPQAVKAPIWKDRLKAIQLDPHELSPQELEADLEGMQAIPNDPLSRIDDSIREFTVQPDVEFFAFGQPDDFDYEFGVIFKRGVLHDVVVLSTGKEGPDGKGGTVRALWGTYPLQPLKAGSSRLKEVLPWPWIRSRKYDGSPMYWGLHIVGGYYSHSTAYYAQLGVPASKGCLRMYMPDAMSVFNVMVNEIPNAKGRITITKGTRNPKSNAVLEHVLQRAGMTRDQLAKKISEKRQEITRTTRSHVPPVRGEPAEAHNRPTEAEIPSVACGVTRRGVRVDCWDAFAKTDRRVWISDQVFESNAPIVHSSGEQRVALKEAINRVALTGEDIFSLNPARFSNLLIWGKGGDGSALEIRVCERSCGLVRKIPMAKSGRLEFPIPTMIQRKMIQNWEGVYLEIKGRGEIQGLELRALR